MFPDISKEIIRLQKEMNRIFRDFWEDTGISTRRELSEIEGVDFRKPYADIKETENELRINFELPGVEKKDIQLNVTPNRITVKASRKTEVKTKKRGYVREERKEIGFYRSMRLPEEVIPEKTSAEFRNGILKVVLPKAKKEKIKKIAIK